MNPSCLFNETIAQPSPYGITEERMEQMRQQFSFTCDHFHDIWDLTAEVRRLKLHIQFLQENAHENASL